LADKMGHVMQRVKTGQRRTFLIYFIVAIALIGGAFAWNRYSASERTEASERWVRLYDGSKENVLRLAQGPDKDTQAGKAARFQLAWFIYWDAGVKVMGVSKKEGTDALKSAASLYNSLVEDCKDDPIFEPQAMLGRAVVTESRAIEDRKYLKQAKEWYKELVDKEAYKETAEVKFAKKRLDILEDANKSRDLENTYKDLQGILGIDAPMFNPHIGVPGFDKEK
jgi:hypothetical protein